MYDLVRDLLTGATFRFLKYSLTFLGNLVGIRGESFSILTGTVLFLSVLLPLITGFTLEVNFEVTFYLKEFKWLSV